MSIFSFKYSSILAAENKGKILAYTDVRLSVSEIAKKVGISEEEVKTILLNEEK